MAKYQKGTGLQNASRITQSIYGFFKSQQGDILSLFEEQPMSTKKDGGYVGGMDVSIQNGLLDLLPNVIDYDCVSEELPKTWENWPPLEDSFWLIDPYDGTHNAGRGSFNFGSMGALIEKFSVVLSWIYLPMEEQALGSGFYFAIKGHGAFQRVPAGFKPLHVSRQDVLAIATVNLEGVSKKLPDYSFANALRKAARNSNGQSCAWNFALMAKGAYKPLPLDAMVSFNNKPWDNIPGTLIVEEAGGKVTDFYGRPWSLENCSSLIFSNGALHDQLLRLNCPEMRQSAQLNPGPA